MASVVIVENGTDTILGIPASQMQGPGVYTITNGAVSAFSPLPTTGVTQPGTTPAYILSGIGIFINVASYGAKSDLITDDAPFINTAIATSPVGSTIWFPGNHLVGSTIQLLPNRTYLAPIGYFNGVTFKQKNGANLVAVLASSDWYNNSATSGYPLRLYNIAVDANLANNASTTYGIVLMNFDSIIEGCSVINSANHGIVLSASNQAGTAISNTMVENKIINCKVNNCGARGIYLKDANLNANTDWYLEGCIVSNCTGDCISADNAAGAFIQRNHVYGGHANGYTLGNCYSTFIIGNEVDGYGSGVTSGNYVYGMSISMIGPRAVVIEGNIISNGSENSGAHYHHLEVHSNYVGNARVHITGNNVLGAWPSSATESLGLNLSGVVGGTLLARHVNNKYDQTSFNAAFDGHTTFDSLELNNPISMQWKTPAYWYSDNGITIQSSINVDGNGSFICGGSVATAIATKTAAYTLTSGDSTIRADATSAAFTVTLPTAVGCAGRRYAIKRINSGANAVTVATTSSQTIDGATTNVLNSQYASIEVQSDGANWNIL